MSAHELPNQLYQVGTLKINEILDPGTGNAIKNDPGHGDAYLPLTVGSGVETRTLAAPDGASLVLCMCLRTDGGGTIAVTVGAPTAFDASGNTILTFGELGDYCELRSIETAVGTFVWRLRSNVGMALSS